VTDRRVAAARIDVAAEGDAAARIVPAVLLAGLALLLVALVFGRLTIPFTAVTLQLPYKALARGLAIGWLVTLALPGARRAAGHRGHPSDVPLLLFVAVAALSVACGEGHWGDVRNLAAATGIALAGRALFAPPARRGLLLHYLGVLAALVLIREIAAHPRLLLLDETVRYGMVTANPNVVGFLFAMLAPLFIGELLAVRAERSRGAVAAAGVYAAVAVAGVLLTFSRTAAAGLAIGAVAVALHTRRRAAALALAATVAAVFLAAQRPDTWTGSRASGDADRLRIMRTSLSLFADAPILGIGFGINNLEERFPARFEALYGERLFRFHSANQLVDLLVGTGVIGTAVALWWAVVLGRDAARATRRTADGERMRRAGALGALTAAAAMSIAEPPLYAGKLIIVLFLVVAYATLPRDGEDRQPPARTSSTPS
jgi:O-antigen ligase